MRRLLVSDKATTGIREALGAYVAELYERGVDLPAPHHVAGTVIAA
jgi:hypothetical protein